MKKVTFKKVFSYTTIVATLAILFCIVLSSCTVSRPVNKGDLDKYHTELQHYYQHQQKRLNK